MFDFFKKSFKKEESSAVEMHNKKMEQYANQFSGFSLNIDKAETSPSNTSSNACSDNPWYNTNLNNIATSTLLDESLDNLRDYSVDSVLNFESDTDFEFEDYSIYEDMF